LTDSNEIWIMSRSVTEAPTWQPSKTRYLVMKLPHANKQTQQQFINKSKVCLQS